MVSNGKAMTSGGKLFQLRAAMTLKARSSTVMQHISGILQISGHTAWLVGWLEFSIPFQHKYGYHISSNTSRALNTSRTSNTGCGSDIVVRIEAGP